VRDGAFGGEREGALGDAATTPLRAARNMNRPGARNTIPAVNTTHAGALTRPEGAFPTATSMIHTPMSRNGRLKSASPAALFRGLGARLAAAVGGGTPPKFSACQASGVFGVV
jgi:hypothetical protein